MSKRSAYVLAALLVGSSAPVWADTPIGPGVTGSGGTGADAADAKGRPAPAGQGSGLREDGSPKDQADRNVRKSNGTRPGVTSTPAGSTSGSGRGSSTESSSLPPADASMGK